MDLRERMAARRLAHAYLVTGPERRALAGDLMRAWVCTGDRPPCGTCPGCRKTERGIHPDVKVLDEAGEGLKAAEVRAVRTDAYVRPNEAPRKVYCFAHAELLNPTGQNVLLKLIEEGPAYACFLFLAPAPELLLPTVRSRCETLRAPGAAVEAEVGADAAELAGLIARGAGPAETLPLLISLEKRDRAEIALLLDQVCTQLAAQTPERPDLVPVLGELSAIRAACTTNISAGHLAGWIASVL